MIPLEVQGHIKPYWKDLSINEYEPRGLRSDNTLKICKAFVKKVNLLHKRGLGPFLMASTVTYIVGPGLVSWLEDGGKVLVQNTN